MFVRLDTYLQNMKSSFKMKVTFAYAFIKGKNMFLFQYQVGVTVKLRPIFLS